jgi:hypothetical protein
MSNSNKNDSCSTKLFNNNANSQVNDGYSPRDGFGYKSENNSPNFKSRSGGYSPGFNINPQPASPPPPPTSGSSVTKPKDNK